MSFKKAKESFSSDLEEIKKAGLWKTERIINSDQKSKIQLSDNQDMPAPVETKSTPVVKVVKPVTTNSISNEDLTLHMQLAVDQLETTVLMLQVLDQADGGTAPTE